MLNGDDNENGFKTNRSNQQKKKTNCTCSTLFLLISKKQICTCSTLFCLAPLAVVLLDYNAVLYDQNVKHPSYTLFTEELSYVLTQYFVSCGHVRFYFSLPLILTLPGRQHFSFSHRRFEFPYFSSQEIRLSFSITRSSSFFVIHVSVNIKK